MEPNTEPAREADKTVQMEENPAALTTLAPEAGQVQCTDESSARQSASGPAGHGRPGKVLLRVLSVILPALMVALLATAIVFVRRGHVEIVLYDGDTCLGAIDCIETLDEARRATVSELYSKTGMDPQLSDQIYAVFRTFYTPAEYLTVEELKTYLKTQCEWNLFEGYVLTVGQTDIAACESEEEILGVLQRLKTELTRDVAAVNESVIAVEISDVYSVTYKYCDASLRTDAASLYAALRPDGITKARLIGEALALRSPINDHGNSSLDITTAKPIWSNVREEYAENKFSFRLDVQAFLSENDALTENAEGGGSDASAGAVPHLEFCLCTLRTVETVIPYHCVVQEDDTKYPYYCRVTQEGSNGLRTTVYRDRYVNGELVGVDIASEEDTVPTVDRIEVHGSKAYPEAGVTVGSFILPIDADAYIISSYFAERRPEFDGSGSHLGIDIVADEWTPIYAADGGVVSWSRMTSSYGNMVRIDHADGFQTIYAHMVEAVVETGQEVHQGQLIGYVGRTGVTSGYHLHFEVRRYGYQRNPMDYFDAIPRKRY